MRSGMHSDVEGERARGNEAIPHEPVHAAPRLRRETHVALRRQPDVQTRSPAAGPRWCAAKRRRPSRRRIVHLRLESRLPGNGNAVCIRPARNRGHGRATSWADGIGGAKQIIGTVEAAARVPTAESRFSRLVEANHALLDRRQIVRAHHFKESFRCHLLVIFASLQYCHHDGGLYVGELRCEQLKVRLPVWRTLSRAATSRRLEQASQHGKFAQETHSGGRRCGSSSSTAAADE